MSVGYMPACNVCGNWDSDLCKDCRSTSKPGCIPSHYTNKIEKSDLVNHPEHYRSETGLETIDVIEAFTFGLNGIEAVDTGNIIKYVCRWKKKNGLQDLKKAQWYLNHLIEHIEKLEKESK